MDINELKSKIRAILSNEEEATAKQITKALDMEKYPSDVVKALSEMRTDAEVECEKRKGHGNEYRYWLVTAEAKPAPVAAKQPAKSFEQRAVEIADHNHNRVIDIKDQLKSAETAVASWMELAAEFECKSIHELRVFINSTFKRLDILKVESKAKASTIAELQTKLGYAQQQVEALTEQLIGEEEAIDIKDAARGYLVVAPKRKPAKFIKPETAVAKAKAAAKATGRGEVFALVPVGIATRKQVQAIQFKEAKAA